MKRVFRKGRGLMLSVVFIMVPFFAFPQDDASLGAGKIPSLEDIARQTGNPIRPIMWRTERGNLRFKQAVKCGSYERRFYVEGRKVVFEDRAEMGGDWQEWYKTGENELEEGKGLEETLLAVWDWDFGITLYQENINKTMVIKFISEDRALYKDDMYVYFYGEWYFIEGKL
jgi:hypothetical protein